jgi:hypothetical protein
MELVRSEEFDPISHDIGLSVVLGSVFCVLEVITDPRVSFELSATRDVVIAGILGVCIGVIASCCGVTVVC